MNSIDNTKYLPDNIILFFDGFFFNGKYQIIRHIKNHVYLGKNKFKDENVAVKIKKIEIDGPKYSTPKYEYQIYRKINQIDTSLPTIFWYGDVNGYSIIVMTLLGPSLNQIFKDKKTLKVQKVARLANDAIDLLEYIHCKEHIHGDVAPSNFLRGQSTNRYRLYLINFGKAKRYRKGKMHISYNEGKPLLGNPVYASLNAHLGLELTRRDDLESLGYVLLYIVKGLPWIQLRSSNTSIQRCERISEKKMSMSIEQLCEGLPIEFMIYLNYCRRLRFEEKPKYGVCRYIFKYLCESNDVLSKEFI